MDKSRVGKGFFGAMASRVVTVAFEGVEARKVDVEVQLTGCQTVFVIVCLADKAVAES